MSSMNAFDARQVLGVAPGAEPAEVTRAYRRAAMDRHPDTGTGDGWDELQEAYAVLVAEGAAEPEQMAVPVETGRRAWQDGPGVWLRPLLLRVVVGALLLAGPAWYLLAGPAASIGVPWQVRAGLLSYGVVWWLIALVQVFRRPTFREARWSIVPVPLDAEARRKLLDRITRRPAKKEQLPDDF